MHGPEIAAGEPGAEHSDPGYCDVILESRLRHALAAQPGASAEPLEDAFRKLTRRTEHRVSSGDRPFEHIDSELSLSVDPPR